MKRTGRLVVALAMGALAVGCTSEVCDAEELRAALAAAGSGDTVRVGSCAIEGSFRVPAGVTLAGAGPESILRSEDPSGPVVRLDPGTTPSRLEDIAIESGAAAAVYASGAGSVGLRGVTVSAHEGVGALFIDVTQVTIESSALTGQIPVPEGRDHTDAAFTLVAPAAPESVMMLPDFECGRVVPRVCSSDERRETSCPGCGMVRQYCNECGDWVSVMATQGLTLVRVGEATLTDVDVRAFAEFGVVAQGTGSERLSWTGGEVAGNMGTGLYANGVDVTLDQVDIAETYGGFRSAPAVAGFVIGEAGPASLATTQLGVSESRGFGLIQVGGTAGVSVQHDGLAASGNDLAAVWVSQTASFEMSNAMVANNRFAGVVVVSSSGVTIRDTMVMGTETRTTTVGADAVFGMVTLGDGVQLFDSTSNVLLQGLTLDGNERLGLSLDLGAMGADEDICGASGDGLCFDSVTVRADPGQRGAIAGNMTTETDPNVFSVQPVGSGAWDTGITREGAAIDDSSFADPLELTGAIAPLDHPIAGAIAPLD